MLWNSFLLKKQVVRDSYVECEMKLELSLSKRTKMVEESLGLSKKFEPSHVIRKIVLGLLIILSTKEQ
ncbi:hypothetical protein EPI10_021028 [Gossypium australe]|uniref:Uncharacterized protein n=1 Tax=Gossypium australe TaxID=47621 RepID=A0A5B6WHD0_9ROSI|nr:hypothetical protein EPI10_021028 [Gossypium australe]